MATLKANEELERYLIDVATAINIHFNAFHAHVSVAKGLPALVVSSKH